MKPSHKDTPVHHLLQHCYELGIVAGLVTQDIKRYPDNYDISISKPFDDNKYAVLGWCKAYQIGDFIPLEIFREGFLDAHQDYCKQPEELATFVKKFRLPYGWYNLSMCPMCIKPRKHE